MPSRSGPLALAIVLTFVAAIGFGAGAVFIRVATQRIPAPTATLFAVLTSIPIAVTPAIALHHSEMLGQPLEAYGWFAIMALLAYPLAFVFLNVAIKLVGASRSAPFQSAQPIFAFTLGTLFLGEEPGLLVAVGTPVIVAGLALVLSSRASRNPSQRSGRTHIFGYLLAIVSASAFATRDVISRHVVSGLAPPLVTSAYTIVMGVVMLLAFTLPSAISSFRGVPPRYILMCILAGVCQGVANVSLFQALSLAPVTVVSPTLATQSLFVLAIAHFTLTRLESVTMPLVIGTTLTVVGVALVVLGAAN